MEPPIEGAYIRNVEWTLPYYSRLVQDTRWVPWLGQRHECTYLNRTKVLNEPPVLDYDTIQLEPIPSSLYEIEQFDLTSSESGLNKIYLILFIVLILLIARAL